MQPRVFFDIETTGDMDAVALLPEPTAPTNYKDEQKIAEYVVKKRAKQVEKAALDPDTGNVVAVSYGVQDSVIETFTRFKYGEQVMITAMWNALKATKGAGVGYNILRFDLPFLLRRSMALGIKPKFEFKLDLRRYQVEPMTDLMQILAGWDTDKVRSLKWFATRYDIPRTTEFDGSMVDDLNEEELEEYVADDVRTTMGLFNMMNGVYFDL